MVIDLLPPDSRVGLVTEVRPFGPRPPFEGRIVARVQSSDIAPDLPEQWVVVPDKPGGDVYFAVEAELD